MAQQIAGIALYVEDPAALAAFYCEVLGMHRRDVRGQIAVGYDAPGAALILRQAACGGGYHHDKTDRYWKIALTLPDLDHARAEIAARGVEISAPHQFREIAYMCHLSDPEGHVIELIQHSFAGKPLSAVGDRNLPLGGGAQLGLITLRTSEIESDMRKCQQDLGLRYLSRQAVSDRGFDLYFLAATHEAPPDADVNAVANREWLWQRPYTTLEFQHVSGGPTISAAMDAPAEVLLILEDGSQFWLQ